MCFSPRRPQEQFWKHKRHFLVKELSEHFIACISRKRFHSTPKYSKRPDMIGNQMDNKLIIEQNGSEIKWLEGDDVTFPLAVRTEAFLFHRFLDSGQSFVPAIPAPSDRPGQRVGSSPYTLLPLREVGNIVVGSFTYYQKLGRYPSQIPGEADRALPELSLHIKLLWDLTGHRKFAISMAC